MYNLNFKYKYSNSSLYWFVVIFYTKKMIEINKKNLDYKNDNNDNNNIIKFKSVKYNSIYSIFYMLYILFFIFLVSLEIDFFEKDGQQQQQ